MITQPFTLPDDGWFQISAIGDFPHATTGLVQVIDADAIAAIVQKFTEESAKPNFPGVLVDWDHASLDLDKPTEAAGWIMNLQQRPDGLWGQVRWSDRGAEAISGGRYRFMSPVWRQEDCLALGEKKVRPLRLFNCALTNDPNIKGMVPFSKSCKAKSSETVVFAFVTFKSRKHRDMVNAKVMKDPKIHAMCNEKNMPFDVKRMIYGGFKVIVESK